MSKTVLIAESNNFLLEALTGVLSRSGFIVTGTTSTKTEIGALALKTRPNLLLFDFSLLSGGMAELTDFIKLKEQLPEMKILILGFHEATDQFAETILNAGFDGFWNKYDTTAGLKKILNFLFP